MHQRFLVTGGAAADVPAVWVRTLPSGRAGIGKALASGNIDCSREPSVAWVAAAVDAIGSVVSGILTACVRASPVGRIGLGLIFGFLPSDSNRAANWANIELSFVGCGPSGTGDADGSDGAIWPGMSNMLDLPDLPDFADGACAVIGMVLVAAGATMAPHEKVHTASAKDVTKRVELCILIMEKIVNKRKADGVLEAMEFTTWGIRFIVGLACSLRHVLGPALHRECDPPWLVMPSAMIQLY